MPADGTSAANVGNGDLRYVAAVFGQLSDKLRLVRISHLGCRTSKHNSDAQVQLKLFARCEPASY